MYIGIYRIISICKSI